MLSALYLSIMTQSHDAPCMFMFATFRIIYLLMIASLKHPLTTAHLLPRASDFPTALRDGVKMYDLGFL